MGKTPVIVGTAGHIDHGKTTLIHKLTGVDTDRLPEEKKRGITIVLGFAPLSLSDGRRVGVVDVPGHERFVKNMVAGAGGIDVALMVVAADEGMKPQTREHLEICQLLGIQRGMVALTKADRAEPDLVELAQEEVMSEVVGTFLEGAAVIPCSAITGHGIDQVRAELERLIDQVPTRQPKSLYLPIDRNFTMKGFGTVITGTCIQGELGVGDTVELLPQKASHPTAGAVKVRGLQVFGKGEDRAWAGQRTAVNLQGVDLDSLGTGQALFTPGTARPTRKLSVYLTHLPSRGKKLKSGARCLLHTGTALVEAGITLMDADRLEPGESGFATVRLSEDVATLAGQRFIARGFETVKQAGRTIAGGVVLDPEPGRRRRKQPRTLAVLEALHRLVTDGPQEERLENAVIAIVSERTKSGLQVEDVARRLGMSANRAEKLARAKVCKAALTVVGDWLIANATLTTLGDEICEKVNEYHRAFPFRPAISIAELSTRLGLEETKLVNHVGRRLAQEGRLALEPEGLRSPKHKPKAQIDSKTRDAVLAALKEGALMPPIATELQNQSGLDAKTFKELMNALIRDREVIAASTSLYFDASAWRDAKNELLDYVEKNDSITTQAAKEIFGLSRKFLIPLLESFDKNKVTMRVGEARKARPGAREI